MSERVLVTGASGFIGSFLAEALLAQGAEVHVLLRPGSSLRWLERVRGEVRVQRADLTDPEGLRRVARAARPEVVFHLAAAGVTDVGVDPVVAVRVNVEGTLNLLAALDGAYRAFVNTGTCLEYGANEPPFREEQDPRPELPYAIAKTAAWHFCRRLHRTVGWPIVTVRPFAVYGPRQAPQAFIPACIRAVREGRDFEMTMGEQRRDLVYVEDVVRGMIRAARTPEAIGGTFNLCSGQGIALYELARLIVAQMGDRIAIRRGALAYRAGGIWHLVGDPSRARTVLGWTPQVMLQEGLRRTIAALESTE